MQINTYKKMNEEIKNILRVGESPTGLYAAQRIEELEEEVVNLTVKIINLEQERLSEMY